MCTDADLAATQVVESLRVAFSDEAMLVDAILLRDHFDKDSNFIWIERFSQFTTDAIKRRDFKKATQHLQLLSGVLSRGGEFTLRCIDVAYVESLMWDISDDSLKRDGWKLIPANLKELYVAMWGERPFMIEPHEG